MIYIFRIQVILYIIFIDMERQQGQSLQVDSQCVPLDVSVEDLEVEAADDNKPSSVSLQMRSTALSSRLSSGLMPLLRFRNGSTSRC